MLSNDLKPNVALFHDCDIQIFSSFDSFHVETGELVIVVEYVAGMTLEEEIHKGRLTEIRTLYILKEVFDALTEAHKAGIIHRDLKPSNIMLEEIGDRTLVKILDFGIAKHLGSTGLTAGGTLGTPAYMSPEQVEELLSMGGPIFTVWALWPMSV